MAGSRTSRAPIAAGSHVAIRVMADLALASVSERFEATRPGWRRRRTRRVPFATGGTSGSRGNKAMLGGAAIDFVGPIPRHDSLADPGRGRCARCYRTLPSSQTAIRHAARCAVPGENQVLRPGRRTPERSSHYSHAPKTMKSRGLDWQRVESVNPRVEMSVHAVIAAFGNSRAFRARARS